MVRHASWNLHIARNRLSDCNLGDSTIVLRAFKLSPLVICTSVSLLAIGELALGTSLYFTAMMAIAMLSIGITFNLLGGFTTFGGFFFSAFALRTIVISQFAKVLLLEAADKNLDVPRLTISVYAVFYLSAMVGVFLFGKVRLRLPRPMESLTGTQAKLLYTIALSVGVAAMAVFDSYNQSYGEHTEYTGARSLALAFSPLLLFSLVLAVDTTIKKSNGKHSISVAVLVPWVISTLDGFIDTVRTAMLMPVIIYFVTCYLRGYRFKRRHILAAALVAFSFFAFIGPLEVFTRFFIANQPLSQRIYWSFHTLATHHDPREWRDSAAEEAESLSGSREQYYSKPGTSLLSRLSLIRADSDVIDACSSGTHYGFAAIKIEALQSIPSFLYKNKPRFLGGADYIGRVAGLSAEGDIVSFPAITAVSDSYGSFGWLGVVLFPLICFPLTFIIYESIFDISKPWGTVAFGAGVVFFGEMTTYRFLSIAFRMPVVLLLLSYLLVGLVKMVPNRGDHFLGWRTESLNSGKVRA